jgi:hypothetical protein
MRGIFAGSTAETVALNKAGELARPANVDVAKNLET